MSLTADIVSTVSGFFADNNFPQDKAVLLVKELIEDLDGDPETWGVESAVAKSYTWHKEHAAQPRVQPTACTCERPWLPIGGEGCERCGGSVDPSRR